jgi:hypothetical protein
VIVVAETAHAVAAVVTFQAGRAILGLVLAQETRGCLSLFMAGSASFNPEKFEVRRMAFSTIDYLTAIIRPMQRKAETRLGEVVERAAFQGGGGPCLGGVACTARLGEHTGMYSGLLVAASAVARDLAKNLQDVFRLHRSLAGGSYLCVAETAGNPRVPAIEWECGRLVVKTRHDIATIVASQAIQAKIGAVFLDEGKVLVPMAVHATLQRNGKRGCFCVAGEAIDGQGVVTHLVPRQAEVCA